MLTLFQGEIVEKKVFFLGEILREGELLDPDKVKKKNNYYLFIYKL